MQWRDEYLSFVVRVDSNKSIMRFISFFDPDIDQWFPGKGNKRMGVLRFVGAVRGNLLV
jgi:hypothetical protein